MYIDQIQTLWNPINRRVFPYISHPAFCSINPEGVLFVNVGEAVGTMARDHRDHLTVETVKGLVCLLVAPDMDAVFTQCNLTAGIAMQTAIDNCRVETLGRKLLPHLSRLIAEKDLVPWTRALIVIALDETLRLDLRRLQARLLVSLLEVTTDKKEVGYLIEQLPIADLSSDEPVSWLSYGDLKWLIEVVAKSHPHHLSKLIDRMIDVAEEYGNNIAISAFVALIEYFCQASDHSGLNAMIDRLDGQLMLYLAHSAKLKLDNLQKFYELLDANLEGAARRQLATFCDLVVDEIELLQTYGDVQITGLESFLKEISGNKQISAKTRRFVEAQLELIDDLRSQQAIDSATTNGTLVGILVT